MNATVAIPILARPGSPFDSIVWEPWRQLWVVRVRAPPLKGKANDAILLRLANWLSVPPSSVRWRRAGSSALKVAEVVGLDPVEVERRLAAASYPIQSRRTTPTRRGDPKPP